jgi:diacylglycerol kinase (ATP)
MYAVRVKTSDGKEKLFTGGGGIGLDARAAHFASTTFRTLTGRRRYLLAAARALVNYKPVQARVNIHSSAPNPTVLESDAILLAVLNTPSYGAGLRFAPEAVTNDGI